jgi:hypothetical protein
MVEAGEEVGLEVGSGGVSGVRMYIDPASHESIHALAATLATGGSRDAFKMTRKLLIPKNARNLQAIRMSERVSFIPNVPRGWKFSGKVALGAVILEHVLFNQYLKSSTGFLKQI